MSRRRPRPPSPAPRRFLLPGCAPPRLRTDGPSACSRSRQPRAGRAERRPQTAEGGPGVQSPPCPAPSCPASLTASYSRRRVSVRPRLCRSCARRRRSTEATSAGRACDRAELRRGDAGPPLLLSAKCVYERDVELVCELMCNCCKCTASDTADLQTEPTLSTGSRARKAGPPEGGLQVQEVVGAINPARKREEGKPRPTSTA